MGATEGRVVGSILASCQASGPNRHASLLQHASPVTLDSSCVDPVMDLRPPSAPRSELRKYFKPPGSARHQCPNQLAHRLDLMSSLDRILAVLSQPRIWHVRCSMPADTRPALAASILPSACFLSFPLLAFLLLSLFLPLCLLVVRFFFASCSLSPSFLSLAFLATRLRLRHS